MTYYIQRQAGEWIQPTRQGYKAMCCDCGLIHRLNFRLISYANGKRHKIQFQAFRAGRGKP